MLFSIFQAVLGVRRVHGALPQRLHAKICRPRRGSRSGRPGPEEEEAAAEQYEPCGHGRTGHLRQRAHLLRHAILHLHGLHHSDARSARTLNGFFAILKLIRHCSLGYYRDGRYERTYYTQKVRQLQQPFPLTSLAITLKFALFLLFPAPHVPTAEQPTDARRLLVKGVRGGPQGDR